MDGSSTWASTVEAASNFFFFNRESDMERVQALQARLAASTDLNPLVQLMGEARKLHAGLESAGDVRAHIKPLTLAVRVVCQSFVSLCASGTMDVDHVDEHGRLTLGNGSDAQAKVLRWLRQQWNTFVSLVHDELLVSSASSVRLAALEVSMSLQSAASEALARSAMRADALTGRWSATPFRTLLSTFLWRNVADDVADAFADHYLEVYDDVRFAFCRELTRLLRHVPDASPRNAHVRSHARALLVRITAVPTEEAHLNNYLLPHLAHATLKKSKKMQRKMFTEDGDESDDETPVFSESDHDDDVETAAPMTGRKRGRRSAGLLELVHSLPAQQQAFASAWLSLLLPATHTDSHNALVIHGGALTLAETHDILVRLHSQILPFLPKPTLLHDFLVDCLDTAGTTALLALNGLYTLIVSHNLDYPAFYTRLYALLDASVMHTRYRSRFMRMLDTFLSSPLLPVAIVASFLKRLSRLSLRATPAALVEIVPFVWNLLRRHPSCMQMIHRDWNGDHLAIGPSGVEDGFRANEPNPLHTNALESSLWEIAAFGAHRLSQANQHREVPGGGDAHYLASITTFASILAEPFTQQRYELEDFLDTTYSTLFETETKKTLKRRERANKPPPAPPVAPLEFTLSVPPMLAGKSGSVDAAVRRETRKRLRRYAFPCGEEEAMGTTPLEEDRRRMRLDDCAELWTW